MPDHLRKLFTVNENIVTYRITKDGYFEARLRRGKYNIEVAAKDFTTMKHKFLQKLADKVLVLYMHYKTPSRQVMQIDQLLPVSQEAIAAAGGNAGEGKRGNDNAPCIFEPDANAIFNAVLPLYINSVMQEVCTENNASEAAARVMAMQTASDNAQKLLEDLQLEYNKLRQQSITTELLDILGGQVER